MWLCAADTLTLSTARASCEVLLPAEAALHHPLTALVSLILGAGLVWGYRAWGALPVGQLLPLLSTARAMAGAVPPRNLTQVWSRAGRVPSRNAAQRLQAELEEPARLWHRGAACSICSPALPQVRDPLGLPKGRMDVVRGVPGAAGHERQPRGGRAVPGAQAVLRLQEPGGRACG